MPSFAALQVAQPNINPVGYFNASQQQAQQEKALALEQKKQGLQGLYMMSAGMLRGNLEGQADPNEWEQGLDFMLQQGADPKVVEGLRGKPHLANILATGSAEALRYSLDERQLDAALKKLELDIQQAAAGPDPTSDMREYEMARQQGFEGSFMDYQTAVRQAGATTVNVGGEGQRMGTIPPGMAAVPDPTNPSGFRMERIPGGPAAEEAAAAEAAAANAQTSATTKGNIVVEDVNRALEIIKRDPFWTTGLVGKVVAEIGGNPATDVKRLADTIKANIGFRELNQMRKESPTGGALGQVTERELQFLQSVIGSLEQDQTAEQLQSNLERVKRTIMDIVHGEGNWQDDSASQTFTTSNGIEYSF